MRSSTSLTTSLMRRHVTDLGAVICVAVFLMACCGTLVNAHPVIAPQSSPSWSRNELVPPSDVWLNLLKRAIASAADDEQSDDVNIIPADPSLWIFSQQGRTKRQNNSGHQLSITSSIDALRERLRREFARRTALATNRQIEENAKKLIEVGKRRKRSAISRRSPPDDSNVSRYQQ